jgi:diguanylate cyclase (GGDEF)-like protein
MLHILRQIETISACRDRDLLAASVVAGIKESFRAIHTASLLRVVEPDRFALVARADDSGLELVASDSTDEVLTMVLPETLALQVAAGRAACIEQFGVWLCALPIDPTADSAHGLLTIELDHPLGNDEHEALERFARFYSNYIRLLDYSERDTLTQLFNRKTFDESFDRLLVAADHLAEPPQVGQERRSAEPAGESRHWIAVVDIDHFKRVNDTYGHLFGDEVLIRFARLMRKTFRAGDRLFRFGGEEFVILLRPTSMARAHRAFDRFRQQVEQYEFPQVGRVSCSIGYASIVPHMAPSDILGQADQALYYCKNHGRNQVGGFDDLVARGRIDTPMTAATQPRDIDTLFG